MQVALDGQPRRGLGVAPVSVLEDVPLVLDEGLELGGRDQLVLGAVDELHELAQVPIGAVVDESQRGAEVADQEQLADAVEHVGVGRETSLGGRFGQNPVAEAVEVADGHP